MYFRQNDSLETVAKTIEQSPHTARLLELLDERASVYEERGSSEVERLRGYALVSLSGSDAIKKAEPFILEELESGLSPYNVGAAAWIVRELEDPPTETSDLLLSAAARMRTSDEKIWFDTIDLTPRPDVKTTVMSVIFDSLACIGPKGDTRLSSLKNWQTHYANDLSKSAKTALTKAISAFEQLEQLAKPPSCCAKNHDTKAGKFKGSIPDIPATVWGIPMQEQSGNRGQFGDFLSDKPGILAFFYTRCMNPYKCSTTITNLAALQKRAKDNGQEGAFHVTGVTYDPDWDKPDYLTTYGLDRGLEFNVNTRFLRSLERWKDLAKAFDLSVGYGPATVNRHRIDVFIHDSKNTLTKRFMQRLWTVDEAYSELEKLT